MDEKVKFIALVVYSTVVVQDGEDTLASVLVSEGHLSESWISRFLSFQIKLERISFRGIVFKLNHHG